MIALLVGALAAIGAVLVGFAVLVAAAVAIAAVGWLFISPEGQEVLGALMIVAVFASFVIGTPIVLYRVGVWTIEAASSALDSRVAPVTASEQGPAVTARPSNPDQQHMGERG